MEMYTNFKGLNVIYYFQKGQITSYEDILQGIFANNFPKSTKNTSSLDTKAIERILSIVLSQNIGSKHSSQSKQAIFEHLEKSKETIDEHESILIDSLCEKDDFEQIVKKFISDHKISRMLFLDEVNNDNNILGPV
jgi:hypothetical protein